MQSLIKSSGLCTSNLMTGLLIYFPVCCLGVTVAVLSNRLRLP